MTYAADTQVRLSERGLLITQDQINEGIDILTAHNLIGADAETTLYTFLERLSIYGDWIAGQHDPDETDRIFPGWPHTRDDLRAEAAGLTDETRNATWARRFGNDAVRVAACIAA